MCIDITNEQTTTKKKQLGEMEQESVKKCIPKRMPIHITE